MLDKTQLATTQTTVVNACHLASAICSQVLGVSVNDQVHGQAVSRNSINKIVLDEISVKFLEGNK